LAGKIKVTIWSISADRVLRSQTSFVLRDQKLTNLAAQIDKPVGDL